MDQGDLAKASAFEWRGAAALRCLGYGCFFKQISQWEAVMVGQTKDHVTGFSRKGDMEGKDYWLREGELNFFPSCLSQHPHHNNNQLQLT